MRHILIFLVSCYRYLISPWLGQNCRFYPSCSCYAQQALREHGSVIGFRLSISRILRCHPWHPGGYDPLPTLKTTHPSTSHHDSTGNCSHG